MTQENNYLAFGAEADSHIPYNRDREAGQLSGLCLWTRLVLLWPDICDVKSSQTEKVANTLIRDTYLLFFIYSIIFHQIYCSIQILFNLYCKLFIIHL